MHNEASKTNFLHVLNLATKESFFTFNNHISIQIDDVAMESPLGQILTIIFLSHHEESWINKCPVEFEPKFYRRYANDIYLLFESPESARSFCEYMSSKHQDINFSVEHEDIDLLSFLDLKICCKNGTLVTSVSIPKIGLSYTLLQRSFGICRDFKTFHLEIDHLKTLLKNNFPPNFIDSLIKLFLDNLYTPDVNVQNAPRGMFLLPCHSWEVICFKFERNKGSS